MASSKNQTPHIKKAVALGYEQQASRAPKVLASGSGDMAQKIIDRANEYDIPLFKNPELTSTLMNLNVNSEIPAELYQAVADVFLWLMKNENDATKVE